MFENLDRADLIKLGFLQEFIQPCADCGRDPRERRHGWWPTGGVMVFACCTKRLSREHGVDPTQIRPQAPALFGANPGKMLEEVIQATSH